MRKHVEFWKTVLIDSARLKRRMCVVVDGYKEQFNELEMLASECYINQIYPILKVSLSNEALEYITENKAPERLEPEHLLALLDGVDAWISIFGWSDLKKKKRINYPPEYQPSGKVLDKMAKKRVKFVQVMLPPSKSHPLHNVVRRALECDCSKLTILGRKLKDQLCGSKDVNIKTQRGTDLHFSLDDRFVLVEDGILDEEDLAEDFILALPAGVICLYPVEDTVEGTTFVEGANDHVYGTGALKDVTFEFEHGHIVDWKAKKGENSISNFLKKTRGDRDMLGEICLGINENVKNYVGYPNIDELRYGAADFALGDNRPFGRLKTEPPAHWHFSLGPIDLSTEGKAIIHDGKII
jgi:hypothetical protein